MAQLSSAPAASHACGSTTLFRRLSTAAIALALSAALLGGVAAGCARHKKPAADPQAMAMAKQRQQQREQTRREAVSLQQQERQLKVDAARRNQKAEQLRVAAMPLDRDGRSNVLAGKAMCESGDCVRGCAVVARGEEKLERSREMRARADQLDDQADGSRAQAARMAGRAHDLMASLD